MTDGGVLVGIKKPLAQTIVAHTLAVMVTRLNFKLRKNDCISSLFLEHCKADIRRETRTKSGEAKSVQWNLSIPDTLGPKQTVLILEVSLLILFIYTHLHCNGTTTDCLYYREVLSYYRVSTRDVVIVICNCN